MIESNAGTRTITVANKSAIEVAVSRFSVRVLKGPDEGHTAVLSSASMRIGTHPTSDLVLTDSTVSRRHLLLTLTPDGVLAEDLESRNGTWFNGARVRSVFLPEAGVLSIGSTTLKVSVSPASFVVLPESDLALPGIIGVSQALRDIFALVRQLARTDLPVSITGETGTGKELIARALHEAGPRREKPFLVLDCGAILPDLLRSELFGHERGAFTGADRTSKGILEEAAGGTVFLDEVGEMDLATQPQLLRALEIRRICRLGSRKTLDVDFRIVSATNRDLRRWSQEGRFRQDLFYRLSSVTLRLPPLRERVEDIPLLVDHFIASCADRNAVAQPEFAPDALQLLREYAWPGNVRELKSTIEVLCMLSGGAPVLPSHVRDVLPPISDEPGSSSGPQRLEEIEKLAIVQALQATGWNRKNAARRLGIATSTIFEKIKVYGLKPPEPPSGGTGD